MYRSFGSWNSGSPYRRAKAALSTTSGVLSTGGATRAAAARPDGGVMGHGRRAGVEATRLSRALVDVGLLGHAGRAEAFQQLGVLGASQRRPRPSRWRCSTSGCWALYSFRKRVISTRSSWP